MSYFANPAGIRVVDFQRQKMRSRFERLGSSEDATPSESGLWTGLGMALGAVVALSWFAMSSSRSSQRDDAGAWRPFRENSRVYALPDRKAYPITSAADAYRATQRLKQGRIRNRDDAEKVYKAIRRRHPDIYEKYLKGYPISKILESKRRGQAARRRVA